MVCRVRFCRGLKEIRTEKAERSLVWEEQLRSAGVMERAGNELAGVSTCFPLWLQKEREEGAGWGRWRRSRHQGEVKWWCAVGVGAVTREERPGKNAESG